MNTKNLSIAFLSTLLTATSVFGQAYFIADLRRLPVGVAGPRDPGNGQTFVFQVSDPTVAHQVRLGIAQGLNQGVPLFRIAAGGDGVNKNYALPGNPAWNWHVTEFVAFAELLIDADRPSLSGNASDLALDPVAWVRDNGTLISWRSYYVREEIFPDRPTATVNLSTRGFVGVGENYLIGGFVVQGGLPRTLLIQARGPSLGAFGIENPLADPVIDLYRDDVKLATISSRAPLPPGVAALVPPLPETEPAAAYTLNQGAYTAVVRSATNQQGVTLLEIYDLDALVQ
jgi:hypothetical protein